MTKDEDENVDRCPYCGGEKVRLVIHPEQYWECVSCGKTGQLTIEWDDEE